MNIIDNSQTTFLTLFYILDNLLFTHETSSIGGSFPSRLHKGILCSIMGIFIPYNGKLKLMAKKFIIWLSFFSKKLNLTMVLCNKNSKEFPKLVVCIIF